MTLVTCDTMAIFTGGTMTLMTNGSVTQVISTAMIQVGGGTVDPCMPGAHQPSPLRCVRHNPGCQCGEGVASGQGVEGERCGAWREGEDATVACLACLAPWVAAPSVTSYPQVCQHVQCSLFPSFLLFRVCAVYVSVCLYVRQFLVIHCLCLSRGPGEARNPLSLILHQAGRGAPSWLPCKDNIS